MRSHIAAEDGLSSHGWASPLLQTIDLLISSQQSSRGGGVVNSQAVKAALRVFLAKALLCEDLLWLKSLPAV